MSIHNTLYVKFKNNGFEEEGEFIPVSTDYASYIESPTPPSNFESGFIRPLSRNLRQIIIDNNQKYRSVSYDDWLTLGELIKCDALSTDDIDEFELVDIKDLKSPEEDIFLAKKIGRAHV